MAIPTITMPTAGVLGLPTGMKEAGKRVDFKPNDFAFMVETKGYLLAWTRATMCPCTPVSTGSEQPDPNCTLCKGKGYIHFGITEAPDWDSIGEVTYVQKKIIEDSGAMVIRGIISGIRSSEDTVERLGRWVEGTMNLTVRHENKLGHYDRIIALDAQIVYYQILETDGTSYLSARYLITGVNDLRTVDTVYTPDVDYKLGNDGRIEWLMDTPPASGTRVALHYYCHPTWLVQEYPHIVRITSQKFKTPTPRTPLGDPKDLPIQALIRYDFLPDPE